MTVTLRQERQHSHRRCPVQELQEGRLQRLDVRLDFTGSAADERRVKFSKLDEMTLLARGSIIPTPRALRDGALDRAQPEAGQPSPA